jgi:hypothetical protein
MTSSTTLNDSQTILLSLIQEEFKEKIPFSLDEIYTCQMHWNNVYSGRYDEVSRKAGVRWDLQALRNAGHIIFINNNGLYKWIQPMTNSDYASVNETFNTKFEEETDSSRWDKDFVLEQLNNPLVPVPKGLGITFVKRMYISKKNILDHDKAVELGIDLGRQQRVGDDYDKQWRDELNVSIMRDGWSYTCPQPAVSEIKPRAGATITEPILYKNPKTGEESLLTHVNREGRHRILCDNPDHPCDLIDAEHEDYLELFGTTSNNPSTRYNKKVTSDADAISAVRKWVQKGRISSDWNELENDIKIAKVKEFLREHYPHVSPGNRDKPAQLICSAEGIESSMRPWTKTVMEDYLSSEMGIEVGINHKDKVIRLAGMMNSREVDIRFIRDVEEYQVKYSTTHPDYRIDVYYTLSNGSGKDQLVTSENIKTLRKNQRDKFDLSATHNREYAELQASGKLLPIRYHALRQDNETETEDKFYH